MTEHYYDVEGLKRLSTIGALQKEAFEAFMNFDRKVFQEGAVPVKYKELMAIAAAHITRCPYCIEGHTKRAKKAGATNEEIAEAIMVGVAMSAGAAIAHASIAAKAMG